MPHPSERPVSERTQFIRKVVNDYLSRLGKTREEREQKMLKRRRIRRQEAVPPPR